MIAGIEVNESTGKWEKVIGTRKELIELGFEGALIREGSEDEIDNFVDSLNVCLAYDKWLEKALKDANIEAPWI